mmetsp:Transcript_5198/g.13098  ORF Transcript_5198/g.13098 Transcript_5198/m.13098 type:complete len:203 (+) Transcript_5198:186-794(+)
MTWMRGRRSSTGFGTRSSRSTGGSGTCTGRSTRSRPSTRRFRLKSGTSCSPPTKPHATSSTSATGTRSAWWRWGRSITGRRHASMASGRRRGHASGSSQTGLMAWESTSPAPSRAHATMTSSVSWLTVGCSRRIGRLRRPQRLLRRAGGSSTTHAHAPLTCKSRRHTLSLSVTPPSSCETRTVQLCARHHVSAETSTLCTRS